MMNISDIVLERAKLVKLRAVRLKEFETFTKDSDRRLKELQEEEAMLVAGIDLDRLRRGRKIVRVHGDVTRVVHGEYGDQRRPSREKLVEDAKLDLASGALELSTHYFGVKNYAHFGDQREDHIYGYGPKHGTIVFEVGLQQDIVERLTVDVIPLTEQEIEDALYVLCTLRQATEVRKSA